MNTGLERDLEIFRTTWLRAVAYAWSNPEFKKELLCPCNGEDALDVITKAFPDLKGSSIGKAITLSVHEEPEFVWIGDDWSWPPVSDLPEKSEQLTLRIPLEAPTGDAQQHAAAIAGYYAIRPTLFAPVDQPRDGQAHATGSTPRNRPQPPIASSTGHSQSFVASRSRHFKSIAALAGSLAPLFSSQRVFSNLTPQDGRLMYGADTFREFVIALTVIMAKAWKNDEFRSLVQTPGILVEALGYARGYAPPWQLRTNVKHDDKAKWTGSQWKNLMRHELTLSLAKAPERDDWSVALAAYNATGALYPFSCCACQMEPGGYGESGAANSGRDADRR